MKSGVFRKAAAAVFALMLLLLAGGAWYLWSMLPRTSGEIAAPELTQTVRMARDGNGVPHIYADNERDGYFALGLAHAQDRLWQMEAFRRAGRGRLSEFAGQSMLRTDRFLRTIGLSRGLTESVEALPPPVRKAVEAYIAGVNRGMATLDTLPLEFALLGIKPEPWIAEDAVVVSRMMSWRLSGNLKAEKMFAALTTALGKGRLATLYADWPGQDEDVFLEFVSRSRKTAGARTPGASASPWLKVSETASNAWAVGGERSATGAPLLANDPHLGLEAPSLWYIARMVVDDRDIVGATIPGLPFHILGQNGHIAWGATSVGADTQDVFVERVDPSDPNRYLVPGGVRDFETSSEIIAVKGEADRTLTVRRTRHGPVLSDVDPVLAEQIRPGHVAALAFATTQGRDTSLAAAYGLAHARSWPEARDALKAMVSPVLNFFVADRAGAVANKVTGRIPVRKAGRGMLPMPGWTGEYDWQGWIAYDALPERVRGADGVLANANNKVAGADAAPMLAHHWHPDLRHRRAVVMLEETGHHDMASFQAIQNDIRAADADLLMPLLSTTKPADERSASALDRLKAWDRRMSTGSDGALIFTAWQRELVKALFADDLGDLFGWFWHYRAPLVARVLESRTSWCGTGEKSEDTTACENVKTQSLKAALDGLSKRLGDDMDAWKWGAVHKATLINPVFARVPGLKYWADLTRPTGGGFYTLGRGAGPLGRDDRAFQHNHGAGFRAIYDLADPSRSRFVVSTGQSGNPFSRHWGDLADLWQRGDMITVTGTAEELTEAGADMLTLKPDG